MLNQYNLHIYKNFKLKFKVYSRGSYKSKFKLSFPRSQTCELYLNNISETKMYGIIKVVILHTWPTIFMVNGASYRKYRHTVNFTWY